ncbi:MAG: SPFH domain-containing protein [Ruminococcaceae bacterium]|nr:SPFH domain-containing protein [Oscillospiraceae bacterium]
MGLIKTAINTIKGTLADQWKEFFYCEALDNDTLVVRGTKQAGGKKGNDNIISSGSGIAVADGQCMIIVDQGKVVEFCAEPGEYTFDSSSEPSIFSGELGEAIGTTLKTMWTRFTYGGDTGKDQRVYYFNLKELIDNKFGTPTPIPFRVVDKNIGLDIDVSVRCSGIYSFKITNPILFYTNVCGNVTREYTKDELEAQLKAEFISALQPAFGKLSSIGLRPSELPAHALELADAMNEALSKKWSDLRGLSVVSVALNPITLPEEDAELIKNAQRAAIMRDPTMAAATLVEAQSDAMRAAASNQGGAMNGFIGMNMAANAGGMNAGDLFAMGQKQNAAKAETAPADSWKCACGAVCTGKFCAECGAKKPEDGWTCSCGNVNKGKFCSECGAKKPEDAPLYRCDKCGWEPEDPKNPPKFCPECGDCFDENDR